MFRFRRKIAYKHVRKSSVIQFLRKQAFKMKQQTKSIVMDDTPAFEQTCSLKLSDT